MKVLFNQFDIVKSFVLDSGEIFSKPNKPAFSSL